VPQVVPQDATALNRRDKLVALHHQVYLTLRSELLAGRLPTGTGPLPGENELAERFGVSRATLRRALAALEADGLVVRRHGAGTFPVPPRPHLRRSRSAEGVFDEAQEVVDDYDREVLSFREVTPPDFVLEVAPGIGSPCLYMCMVARRDGQAVHLNHQYVPLRFAHAAAAMRATTTSRC
jgi:GntR family transcriptional regulator